MKPLLLISALLCLLASATLAEPVSPAPPIRIGAYNIYTDFTGDNWEKRKQGVFEFVEQAELDILALQEVTEVQIADLARRLPHYHYVLGARSDGHRGDQSWYEFNPIFYAPDRYRLEDWSSFWVSQTPAAPGSILPRTKTHARVLTWAKLTDLKTDRPILVANVHIHGLRAKEEVNIILDELARFHDGAPIILLGDFNMTRDADAYAALVSRDPSPHFIDAGAAAIEIIGPTNTTVIGPDGATYDNGGRMREISDVKVIDYIFLCGAATVRRFEAHPNRLDRPNVYASDHFALTSEVSLAGSCPLAR